MNLEIYGPQRKAEPLLLRRIRAHQSWYRADILGLREWGTTAPPSRTEMGSVLTLPDARRGANFVSNEARSAYNDRRTRGWGVEPYRCEHYMTSSQTLTFNVFAPLAADLAWMARSLNLLGYDSAAGNFSFEYRPEIRRSSRLDKTVIDGFIPTSSGGLVIETKLADQFSRRGASIGASGFYGSINRELLLWKHNTKFEVGAVDQLARVHGAGSASIGTAAELLLVHHPLDTRTPIRAEAYRQILQDPSRLRVLALDHLLDSFMHASISSLQRQKIERLQARYTNMDLSHAVFSELESARLKS